MATPVLPLLPTSELVARAWLGSIDGFSPQMVAPQLPADDTSWAATGFVQAVVVGGSPDIDLPVKKPVLQIDCWATKPGSDKPKWVMANLLAETIRYATLQRMSMSRLLTITSGLLTYPPAVVISAYLMTEIRRIPGDPGDYAHYQFDMAMSWKTANEVLEV